MEFHYTLLAIYSMHSKLLMKKLVGTGLTSGQPKILNYLENNDGSMQNEIAAACFIEPASMTTVLNGMEANGLIERRRKNGNRRTYYIYLTSKGKEMCKTISSAFADIKNNIFSDISTSDEIQYMNAFEKIYSNLKETMEV